MQKTPMADRGTTSEGIPYLYITPDSPETGRSDDAILTSVGTGTRLY